MKGSLAAMPVATRICEQNTLITREVLRTLLLATKKALL